MPARAATSNSSVRVLHLTDPHLFASDAGELRGVNTHRSLQRVLDHYQSGDWRADIAIVSGDLVQDDSAQAYQRFRSLLGTLALPVYCCPGNHDVRTLMQDAVSSEPFHYCATHTHGNWTLAGIDSCMPGEAGGQLDDAELQRVMDIVHNGSTPHALLYLHHPPIELGSRWLDSVGLANGSQLLEQLQETDTARAVLFGHAHQAADTKIGKLRILGTPSTCRQFKPASDDFAVDDKPPAYRQITLHEDGNIDTRLVWVNE